MSKMKIVVACANRDGKSDMFVCTVEASKEDVLTGRHYGLAQELALGNGFTGPFVCFDSDSQSNIAGAVKELDCPVPINLREMDAGADTVVEGTLQLDANGVSVNLSGYSDCASVDDKGIVAFLECYEGAVYLRVYSDINREKPTHNIDFDAARNERRFEKPM